MRLRSLAGVVGITALLLLPSAASAQDQGEVSLAGTVTHGVEGTVIAPGGVTIALNVFEGVSAFDQRQTELQPDGTFAFTIRPAPERSYFVTVDYQGARYSASRQASAVGEPVEIVVYDATSDPGVLSVDSYTVIVTGSVPAEGFVEILERAAVRNNSQMTLVPDLGDGGPMLSFLRFALPPDAYNLDVRSDLVGGQVLTVDRGFALTTPVPPTGGDAHQFEFVYRVPYDQASLDLSRTLRFGAGSVRYVVPVDTGDGSSATLEDLGATDLSGRLLRLLEGGPIAPGDAVDLHIDGLELPSALSTALERSGRWYVAVAAPALAGLSLVALMGIGLSRRKPIAVGAGTAEEARGQLLARVTALEERLRAGKISQRAYLRERDALRTALVSNALPAPAPGSIEA